MNAKHTPGPWTYHATAGNHDFIVYPEAPGRDVALVRDFNAANARLIAAAPELLDMLRSLLNCPDLGLDNLEPETAARMQRAITLLTRIEGNGE